MAPEQLHKGKVLPQGDIYALGILLYEMLTGNLPGRRSPMPSASERVVAAVGKDKVEALDDLFDRMTRDPLHERFESIDAVLDALYAAFPTTLVGARGTLLLSEKDPLPPPPKPAAAAPATSADGGDAPGEDTDTSSFKRRDQGRHASGGGAVPHVEATVVTKAPAELRDAD